MRYNDRCFYLYLKATNWRPAAISKNKLITSGQRPLIRGQDTVTNGQYSSAHIFSSHLDRTTVKVCSLLSYKTVCSGLIHEGKLPPLQGCTPQTSTKFYSSSCSDCQQLLRHQATATQSERLCLWFNASLITTLVAKS